MVGLRGGLVLGDGSRGSSGGWWVLTLWPWEEGGWEPGLVWLLYTRVPAGVGPPRRWRGLVGYGRLDVAARVMLAALYPGRRLLEGDAMLVYLDAGGSGEDGGVLVLEPGCLPGGMVYEREAASVLLEALRGRRCRRLSGVTLRGLLLAAGRRGYRRVGLREGGERLRPPRGRLLLLLGGAVDPPWRLVEGAIDVWAGVGCRSYLASTVAAYVNAYRLLKAAGRVGAVR
ncbi:MAG: hypothetical protein GXO15_02920, partial [Crenarchaeota archaeon]|nr:hypothetical protein [Thermoproteota archaeon]